MTIVVKISFKEYVKLLYGLTYRKPMMKVILCVALAMLIWIIGYYSHLLPVPKPTFFQYSTIVLITIIQPLVIFSTIRKNYKSSNLLQEEVKMEFDSTEIKLRGDSFYTELIWSKIYKVQELKNWFLIYQNSLSAIIIPKKLLTADKLKAFKNLLQTVPQLKLHLKN